MATRTPAPAHLPVEDGTNVECPWHGPRTLDGCRDCAFLQGTLDGPDVEVLCGYGRGAPLHREGPVAGIASRDIVDDPGPQPAEKTP